jgi:integrase
LVANLRKRAADGAVRAISRQQAWQICKAASRRADIAVLAMRASRDGRAGELAPIHPHLFRHSRVRQNLRTTKSLPIVQKQAGWATLQATYLKPDDEEVRRAMLEVQE